MNFRNSLNKLRIGVRAMATTGGAAAVRSTHSQERALLKNVPQLRFGGGVRSISTSPALHSFSQMRSDISPPANCVILFVPAHKAYIIERFGRYFKTLTDGVHILIPFVDKIAFQYSLQEQAIPVPDQMATTKDKFKVFIDGVIYARIVDTKMASYNAAGNPFDNAVQTAQETIREEIGRITLGKAIESRDVLNKNIAIAINENGKHSGLMCRRYAIRDICIPDELTAATETRAVAKLKLEAKTLDYKGDAAAVVAKSQAAAVGFTVISDALKKNGGVEAASLRIAEEYVHEFTSPEPSPRPRRRAWTRRSRK